jgi:hypothetical protein
MISPELLLNPILNLENKDSENSVPIPNQLKKDEQNSIPHENITISLKSEEEGNSTESEPESKGIYFVYEEELLSSQNTEDLSEDKENIKTAQQILGKKRKSHKLSNPNKTKYFSNSKRKMKSEGNILIENQKDSKNNIYSEVNFCYNELVKIMENYSFFEVSTILLKVANEITEDNDDNHELYQKLKNISSKIKNKGNLALICLSALSSKIQLKNDKKGENKTKKQVSSNKDKGKTNMKKTAKKNNKQKLIFSDHFYNINNNIYCYKNKSKNPSYKITLYCEKRHIKGCKAHIIVNSGNESNNSEIFIIRIPNAASSKSSIQFCLKISKFHM